MYITRALIGRNLCWIRPYKQGRLPFCCYFIKQLLYGFLVWMAWSKHLGMLLELRKARKITRLRLVFRAHFLTLAKFPRVWIMPSKHGNHKVIVYWKQRSGSDTIIPETCMKQNFDVSSEGPFNCLERTYREWFLSLFPYNYRDTVAN